IRTWGKHQRIDNAGKTGIPKPEEADDAGFAETRGEIPRAAETRGGSPTFAAGPGPRPGPGKDLDHDHPDPDGSASAQGGLSLSSPPSPAPRFDFESVYL